MTTGTKGTSPTAAPESEIKRLNFNVSPRAYAELSNLAKSTHRSMTEVIRLGVGLVKIALEATREGNRILIVNSGGEPVKEIVIPD